jgi:hypothetical protein
MAACLKRRIAKEFLRNQCEFDAFGAKIASIRFNG